MLIDTGLNMSKERQIILHMATSSDGYIATLDDGLDWLPKPSDSEDYGMNKFMQTVDCVLIGRRTWDVISQFEEEQFTEFERHIISRKTHEGVEFIRELKMKSGKNIWLLGGGILNGECIQSDLIDEIVITQIPIELNEGIPAFGKLGRQIPDSWIKVSEKRFEKDVIQIVWAREIVLDLNEFK